MDTAVKILAAAVICWIVWRIMRPKPDFVIVVLDDEMRIRGRVSAAARAEIGDFLRANARLSGLVKISGRREGGYLSLNFSANVSKEDRQRIRNFLITRL